MIINEESDFVKNLEKVLTRSTTQGFNSDGATISFSAGNGVFVKGEGYSVLIENKDVDVSFKVPLDTFALALSVNNGNELKIEVEGSKAKIGTVTLDASSTECELSFPTNWHFKFTAEQYAALRADYRFTTANYNSPKYMDAITFMIDQGVVKEVLNSRTAYAIKDFDCTVDTASVNALLAFIKDAMVLPRFIYDIFDNGKDVKITFYQDKFIIYNDSCVAEVHSTESYKTVAYFTYKTLDPKDGNIDVDSFKQVFTPLTHAEYLGEDPTATVGLKNGKVVKATIDALTLINNGEPAVSISGYAPAFAEMASRDIKSIAYNDSFIVFKTEKEKFISSNLGM